MGTILARKRKDGSTGYTALIRIKKGGVVLHTESETFEREQAAKAWLKKRETQLAVPGALDQPDNPTLSEVIGVYIKDKLKAHGKTKDQVLRFIQRSELGQLKCTEVTSQAVVKFAKSIDAQPQTVGNYISHLASVILVAKPAWGYPLEKQSMEDAKIVLTKLGLISRSKERVRRPEISELNKLMTHYTLSETKGNKATLPMSKIILFALYSTRRQEEITLMLREDLDAEHSEIMVRDMKNPGEKIGNDVMTHLPSEALQLLQLYGKKTGRLWPYNASSISTSFTRACKILGIEDLHFHDLRHEGITRLFEMGWDIPRVASVSGHRSWTSLKRYTQYRKSGDKYADWIWKTKLLKE
jgi:integrase